MPGAARSAADAGGIGKGPGGDPAPILAGQRRRRTVKSAI
jgi:hypothetical protein